MNLEMQILRRFLIGIYVMVLSGCVGIADPYQSPELDLPAVPEGIKQKISSASWWRSFNDETLTAWVEDALRNNWDLARARARMEEAKASLGSAEALNTPRLDGAVGVSGTRRKFGSNTTSEEFNGVTRTATVGLSLGWELDVWGRVDQMNQSARARYVSSELMRDAAALSVAGLVADTYFQWRTLETKYQITKDAIVQLQAICDLEKRRWQAGLGTELAYQQSLAELASTQAKLPLLEDAKGRSAVALQVLAGRGPRVLDPHMESKKTVIRAPDIPEVLDTQILLRRPDVAAAEWALKAAYSDVNASRAERYPRLSLSVVTGLLTSNSSWVSGTPSWLDTGLNATAPVWDGGMAASKVEASVARRSNATAQYHQSVLQAYRDLQEAVLSQKTSDMQFNLTQSELRLREQSLRFVQKSHAAGQKNLYEVLNEKIKVLQVQLALSDAQQAQWLSRTHFYKAIGGSL
jgi:multidrug efflux system outer membrane protein